MIIIIIFFLYQNVRITEVLTAMTERLRTLITTVIVTVQSDLDGSVSKGPQARECQLHVQLPIGVTLMQPAGWMVDTPQ